MMLKWSVLGSSLHFQKKANLCRKDSQARNMMGASNKEQKALHAMICALHCVLPWIGNII